VSTHSPERVGWERVKLRGVLTGAKTGSGAQSKRTVKLLGGLFIAHDCRFPNHSAVARGRANPGFERDERCATLAPCGETAGAAVASRAVRWSQWLLHWRVQICTLLAKYLGI
jgi:hypothetical protein